MSLIEPLQSADEDGLAQGIQKTSRPGFVRTTLLGNRAAMVGLGILGFFLFVAIFAPWLEPYDPTEKVGPVYAPPSSEFWLGTDDGGGDMLSLLIAGSRVSLGVGFLAALVAIPIGGTVGLPPGYFGVPIDTVLEEPPRDVGGALISPRAPGIHSGADLLAHFHLGVRLIRRHRFAWHEHSRQPQALAAALQGEPAFGRTHQEDHRELQALGLVDGEDVDGIFVGIGFGHRGVRHQRIPEVHRTDPLAAGLYQAP